MDLISDAITTAGMHSRTVALCIRNDDYRAYNRDGIPDHSLACFRIACYLVNDRDNANELNDRHMANDYGYAADVRAAAKRRNDDRTALAVAIDEPVRLGDRGEREGPLDDGANGAFPGENEHTLEVSMIRMNWLTSEGQTRATAGTSTMCRKTCRRVSANACPASICDRCTDSIPARKISVE